MAKIFVSYSHHDQRWLELLKVHLAPLVRRAVLDVWSDERIKPGTPWKDEIATSIGSARAAILLVTPRFLASEFIARHELAPLLVKARRTGTLLMWLAVAHSLYGETEIAEYQALNDPDLPLSSLRASERDKVLVTACKRIKDLMETKRAPEVASSSLNLRENELPFVEGAAPPHDLAAEFWQAVKEYRANRRNGLWNARVLVDRRLSSGVGRVPLDELIEILDLEPDDAEVQMAAAVVLTVPERNDDLLRVVGVLTRLLSSPHERVRYRAAGTIERRFGVGGFAPPLRESLAAALRHAESLERADPVREAISAALVRLK
jgi:hypothetical protein